MKIGIAISVYNRPEYFRETLLSLKATRWPCDVIIYIVNDCSTCDHTNRLFDEFFINNPKVEVLKYNNHRRVNMHRNLRNAWEVLIARGCDVLCNVDADAKMKRTWLGTLLKLYQRFPNNIISGFNTSNHPHYQKEKGFVRKKTIGGINLMFSVETYYKLVRHSTSNGLSWDWTLCDAAQAVKCDFIVSTPSVVQHLGIISTKGHTNGDIAEDY
jgi:glycosyltransferase involved in cell wall biosynthesis